MPKSNSKNQTELRNLLARGWTKTGPATEAVGCWLEEQVRELPESWAWREARYWGAVETQSEVAKEVAIAGTLQARAHNTILRIHTKSEAVKLLVGRGRSGDSPLDKAPQAIGYTPDVISGYQSLPTTLASQLRHRTGLGTGFQVSSRVSPVSKRDIARICSGNNREACLRVSEDRFETWELDGRIDAV